MVKKFFQLNINLQRVLHNPLATDPLQAGRQAIPFEINLCPDSQDILSPQGFANALYQMLRLRPGAGALHAPVCSTWILMILACALKEVNDFGFKC